MAKYELMVVIDPFLEEAETQALVEKCQEQVKRRGGNITQVDSWGKRRLAYPINKKVEGYTFSSCLKVSWKELPSPKRSAPCALMKRSCA